VSVFGPSDSISDIQAAVNAAYASNGGQTPGDNGQFSAKRFAFLFKPGHYNVDVPVGYYTQVAGLGTKPTDVVFTSSKGVFCQEGSFAVSPGALNTFWRTAENFQTDADFAWNSNGNKGMIWAASQASSLRRIVVTNDLDLYQYRQGEPVADYASGGFLANSDIKGVVSSGSQQQFLSRNNNVSTWHDGVWNMVFVGTENAPRSHCGANVSLCSHPYDTTDAAPVIAEKPFITIDLSGKYVLNVPRVVRAKTGNDFDLGTQISFDKVYVANSSNTAAEINSKLKQGLHVVLAPGIYSLDAPLEIIHDNQVLLGMGLATLVATNGTSAVKVGNVNGARVAGILLEAGTKPSESLLQWGDPTKKFAGTASNPGVGNDIYARVGGPSKPSPAQAKIMLRISSGNVIVDNAWLWRADHEEGGILVKNGSNPCEVSVVVDGDDVVMYGVKAEHSLTDQMQWNGERGKTFMFQSELPYDVNQANYGDKGYAGYRVADNVKVHEAHGIGVYHYFRDTVVRVKSAIVCPAALESSFIAPLAVFLNGLGRVDHVLNMMGDVTQQDPSAPTKAVPKWVCPAQSSNTISNGSCKVGDPVTCPGTGVGCKGNTCCPDGSTCPSAEEDFGCCPSAKKADCLKPGPSPPSPSPSPPVPPSPTPPPSPSPTPTPTPACKVGDLVKCPDGQTECAGAQCCPDFSVCPSAPESFHGCQKNKTVDCVKSNIVEPSLEMVI
jgi:hypothetical protein